MRFYIPSSREVLQAATPNFSTAWAASKNFQTSWNMDTFSPEEVAECAQTFAAMWSLSLASTSFPGRTVLTFDLPDKNLPSEGEPGLFSGPLSCNWSQLAAIHLDDAETAQICARVRGQMSAAQIQQVVTQGCVLDQVMPELSLSAGAEKQLAEWWDQLLAEALLWYDASERTDLPA